MRVLGLGEELVTTSPAAVTIGVYDGVHRGHQWLLRRLRKVAGASGPLVVVTFDPHPLSVIRPVAAPRTLTSTRQKLAIFDRLGLVDACLVLPFDASRRDQRAPHFVDEILVRQLHVGNLMVGPDFRFGRDREGDLALLQNIGARRGFVAHSAPLLPVSAAETAAPCSSSYIRDLIRRGNVGDAARLLTRAHRVDGVVAGTSHPRSGRGVPTVVLRVDRAAALPIEGSYLGALVFADGRRHVAGLSIRQGLVAGPHALVDAHLAGDFDSAISSNVAIEFIRPLWATGRAELATQVRAHAEEVGRASAAGGWGEVG